MSSFSQQKTQKLREETRKERKNLFTLRHVILDSYTHRDRGQGEAGNAIYRERRQGKTERTIRSRDLTSLFSADEDSFLQQRDREE